MAEEPNSKEILQSLLGSKVICQLTGGRTARGNLVCIDRLKNIILSDCVCHQEICSADYTQQAVSDPPVTATAERFLQQAMIPGTHLVSIRCTASDYASAVEQATAGKIIGTMK